VVDAWNRHSSWVRYPLHVREEMLAYVTIFAAMMVIHPLVLDSHDCDDEFKYQLPTAYTGGNQQAGPDGINRPRQQDGGPGSKANDEMLAYLQSNTANVGIPAAVHLHKWEQHLLSKQDAPVLYMGGFGGQDEVVTAEDLSAMVANGELRYVLYGGEKGNKEDVASWLKTSCSIVPEFSEMSSGRPQAAQGPNSQQGPGNQTMTLYMCK